MASNKRESKVIKDPTLKQELLNIKEKEITSSFIFGLFGEYDGKCKCRCRSCSCGSIFIG